MLEIGPLYTDLHTIIKINRKVYYSNNFRYLMLVFGWFLSDAFITLTFNKSISVFTHPLTNRFYFCTKKIVSKS